MIARIVLVAFLFSSSSLAAQNRTTSPTLAAAEQALVDALAHADRDAFRQLLAPDAVFFFPKEAHGADAITAAWLPFLMSPELTLVFTIETSQTAVSGDTGQTAVMFAIRGRTNTGMTTNPAGTFTIAWRLVEGQWKIATLSGTAKGGIKLVVPGGVGGFRFGMTRSEVRRVADCSPYLDVSVTGGIECPNYLFNGQKMYISFLFAADQLKRIQLWFYEGDSALEAREAVAAVIDYLKTVAGGAQIRGLPAAELTPAVVMDLIKDPAQPGRIYHIEISSPPGSAPERWFARIGRHQSGYGVMLFAESRE